MFIVYFVCFLVCFLDPINVNTVGMIGQCMGHIITSQGKVKCLRYHVKKETAKERLNA